MEHPNVHNRRNFLKISAQAGLAAGLSSVVFKGFAHTNASFLDDIPAAEKIPYAQQQLPYAYNALEPVIDAMTMEIHYSKHAQTYAKNLADAVQAEKVDTESTSLEKLLGNISRYSPKMRNNAGGHYNHELFWKSMRASGIGSVEPKGKLRSAIEKDFGSLDAFKTQFNDAAKNRFGSGWAWLVATPENKLVIGSTPNQDNPLMDISELKGVPLLGLDVWEHAYYLKYQNRRPDYIAAWWNIVDWNTIEKRYVG